MGKKRSIQVFGASLQLVSLLGLAACPKYETSAAEIPAPEVALNPWEAIDPGFVGCEGG